MNVSAEVVVAAAALIATLVTYVDTQRRNRRLSQADLIRAYTNDFYADDNVTRIFMDVDHERYTFGEADLGTADELSLIRLLDFFNIVGHNWSQGVIRLEQLRPTTVGYAAVRVHRDPAVTWYLSKVAGWDAQRYSPDTGFRYFRQLAKALETTRGGGKPRW